MKADVFESLYKDGDIIVVKRWVVILKGLGNPNEYFPDRHAIIYYALAHIDSNICSAPPEPSPGIGWIEEIPDNNMVRLATNKEKQNLFNKLYRKGVKWDGSLKRLIFMTI
jgi:hypothetical protein